MKPKISSFTSTTEDTQTASSKTWSRPRRLLLDLIGTFVWIYPIVKVFVFDLDRYVVERFAGDRSWLLNYRALFFLAIFALLLFFAPRLRKSIAYVSFFPAIVVFWKLPKLLAKTRNPAIFLGVSHLASSVFANFRLNFLLGVVSLLAAVAILNSTNPLVILPAVLVLLLVWTRSILRTIATSFRPSRFLRLHEVLIARTVNARWFTDLISVDEKLRQPKVRRFDDEQQNKFLGALSANVVANRAIYYWAWQLEKYRKGGALQVFSALSYMRLFLNTLAVLTLTNLAILHMDPLQFTFANPPSILKTLQYSLASLASNNVSGFDPSGQWALAVQVVAALIGPLLLVTLLLNIVLNIRQARASSEFTSTVAALKSHGAELERRLEEEYEITLREAIDRLHYLDSASVEVIAFLSFQIPTDFYEH